MIGKIKGTLVEIDNHIGLIELANGLFYEVYLPTSFLGFTLPKPIEIYTYLQIREDAHVLYGFAGKPEHEMFRLLLTVPGVGPKTAFTVVSFHKPDDLFQAVKDNNVDFVSKVPGLGKKTAMKIILELSQKMKTEFKLDQMQPSEDDKLVIDALVSLGFKTQEAKQILSQIPKNMAVEQRISEGIRLATNPKKKV